MYSPRWPTHTDASGSGRLPLRVGGAALIVLLGLAGCASTTAGASSSTVPIAGGSPSLGAGTPSTGTGTGATTPPTVPAAPGTPANPGGSTTPPVAANPGGPINAPVSQVGNAPAGSKMVIFEGVSRSADGKTLYMTATAGGGACGQYDAVLQESSGTVKIGLAQLPNTKALPCPMFVRLTQFPVTLSAPIGDRQIIDLANGQVVGTGQSVSVISANVPKLPGTQNGEPLATAPAFNPVTS
jgi:hypothetical protein